MVGSSKMAEVWGSPEMVAVDGSTKMVDVWGSTEIVEVWGSTELVGGRSSIETVRRFWVVFDGCGVGGVCGEEVEEKELVSLHVHIESLE